MSTREQTRGRIESIDILRGIVMVIMVLDHVRDFFHKVVVDGGASVATGPTDLATTTPTLFFTRWITHFCAPIFVFLAGTSAYLYGQKRSKKELSAFLIKRGCWLILVEIVIITLGWTFNPLLNVIILQVIWAIGISMILLGLFVRLPFAMIVVTGFIIVFGHNLLDYPSISRALKGGVLADLVYFSQFSIYFLDSDHLIFIVYAFLPWTGVMMLGYCFGRYYQDDFEGRRNRIIRQLGVLLVLLFFALRFINMYGDPVPWSTQSRGGVFTFLSFINITKYPPSLAFLSITLGVGLILLSVIGYARTAFARVLRTFGRVPMFYYILHFYVIHILVVIVFFASGYSTDKIVTPGNPFLFRPSDFGFPLWGVYVVWLLVVLICYPLCRWYERYKSSHRNWWLRFL